MKIQSIQALAIQASLVFCCTAHLAAAQANSPSSIKPTDMPRIGSVDERFQSYNIEMVEVTGGRFWKPYSSPASPNGAAPQPPSTNQPVGMDPNLYQYRPPIDLSNARLRKLAAALGPAYVRVSGTWANSTYFQTTDGPAPEKPPTGFNGVLSRKEWKGVVDFSRAANAEIVTSFATSAGTRDASGAWTPAQAEAIMVFTKASGGRIAAAEYMNEPTFAEMGGAPKGYDAAAYARDIIAFRAFAKQDAPGMLLLGPGGVGEGSQLVPASMHLLSTSDLLTATGSVFDAFSYHSYGGVSSRCGAFGASSTTSPAAALSDDWLANPDRVEQYYSAIRDRLASGKPIWLTETAQTACGGDRWASTFLDSFRYLNQLGGLAKRGVQVQLHNTLASSDYGLLDENTYAPRPNYWAALLWRKLVGTEVLDAGASPATNLHLYAHCLRNHPGGVVVLAINADRTRTQSFDLPMAAERYSLTAPDLMGTHVQLNGSELELGADDALPPLKGEVAKQGPLTLAPASITFLTFPKATNASCR
jgi:heparanase